MSSDSSMPGPGLYGVWATSDGCSWNGDATLDYNYEAPYFGTFSSNHAEQAEAYWGLLLDYQPPSRAMAQQYAANYGIQCDADTLHYACHLGPWGHQSFDDTVYMHWNGGFAALPFINHFEYTLNASFAAKVTLPFLTGLNHWVACAFNKTVGANGTYTYHDTRFDAEHEGQVVPDAQIALALAARTLAAQIEISAALGLPVPPLFDDIASHLVAFNLAKWNYTQPAPSGSFTVYENSRLTGDSGSLPGSTLEECEASCAARSFAECAGFCFCPSRSVQGCDVGPSCWRYTVDKLPDMENFTGFTSGARNASQPDGNGTVEISVWSAYAGASVADSDSFAMYPVWPSEAAVSRGVPMPAAVADAAQGSGRAYIDWTNGRTVDVFTSAVLAGQGFAFPSATVPGGSVVVRGPAAPTYALSPLEVLAGLGLQVKQQFGGNLLLYAQGGGIENIGVTRAINEMFVSSMGGRSGYILLFPMWPASEPAAFTSLLVKGGFLVSAAYSNETRAVGSPVAITAGYTLLGALSPVCKLADPWGVGPSGGITTVCGGVAAPLDWDPAGFVMSFLAPKGVECSVLRRAAGPLAESGRPLLAGREAMGPV